MEKWEAIANATIPRAQKKDTVIKVNYTTGDIIRDVLDTYKETKEQLSKFAPTLKGPNAKATCSNIWHFIKQNLNYQVDPAGVQWVRTPARLWADDIGDCKSFSLFAASLLHCLGIGGFFRFVSFSETDTNPTHVYVVATPSASEHYIIDAVISSFNRETPFKHKIDYDMSTLYTMSGIGEAPRVSKPGELVIPVLPDGTYTDELLAMAITKQRLEIEQSMTARVAGIGSTVVGTYADAINMVNADIQRIIDANKGLSGIYDDGEAVGNIFKKIAKVVTAPVKLVAKGVVAVAKTVKKVATLPLRGIAEVAIPKAGMGFLYTFIKNEEVLAKLPEKVRTKRDKQFKLAKTICDIITMKQDHFFGIAQNGIMKKTGKTPLAFMSDMFGMAVSGIGEEGKKKGFDLLGSLGIVGTVIGLITQLMSLFKKNTDVSAEEAAPDASDGEGWNITPAEIVPLQNTLQQEGSNSSTLEKILQTVQASTEAVRNVQQQFAASQTLPPVQTASVNTNGQIQYGNAFNGGGGYAEMPPVTVYAKAPEPVTPAAAPAADNSKNMMMMGFGLAALYLLTQKKN